VPQSPDRVLDPRNRRLYYIEGVPAPADVTAADGRGAEGDGFVIL